MCLNSSITQIIVSETNTMPRYSFAYHRRVSEIDLRCQFHQHTKVLCTAFLYLQFDFVIFWQKNISAKATRKMLMKLTIGGQFHQL